MRKILTFGNIIRSTTEGIKRYFAEGKAGPQIIRDALPRKKGGKKATGPGQQKDGVQRLKKEEGGAMSSGGGGKDPE